MPLILLAASDARNVITAAIGCGKQYQRRCHRPGCTFMGHRDAVGSLNMHPIAFSRTIDVPAHVTYQRPGPLRVHPRNEEPGTVQPGSRHVVVARTRATGP
ncbi:MAG: hypothetical protein ACLQUY_21710 [Ktedonobacterales bacterium]